jgi:hypothetical protein
VDTTTKNLLNLMSLPTSNFDGVICTSDGHYIARVKGDTGYNGFLGQPSPPHAGPGRDHMLETWRGMTPEERKAVLALAAHPIDGSPIRLAEDFGVPVEDVE